MIFCDEHTKLLHKEIEDQDLMKYVCTSLEGVTAQYFDYVESGPRFANFDPLSYSGIMILQRTVDILGDSAHNQSFCPICKLNSFRKDDGSCHCPEINCPNKVPGSIEPFESWIPWAVTGCKEIALEEQWI